MELIYDGENTLQERKHNQFAFKVSSNRPNSLLRDNPFEHLHKLCLLNVKFSPDVRLDAPPPAYIGRLLLLVSNFKLNAGPHFTQNTLEACEFTVAMCDEATIYGDDDTLTTQTDQLLFAHNKTMKKRLLLQPHFSSHFGCRHHESHPCPVFDPLRKFGASKFQEVTRNFWVLASVADRTL